MSSPDARAGLRAQAPLPYNDVDDFSQPRPLAGQRKPLFRVNLSRTTVCCIALYFMMEMFDMVTVAPLVALFENAICMSYYGPDDAWNTRHSCKIQPIQRELALVRGWKGVFDAIPDLQRLLHIVGFWFLTLIFSVSRCNPNGEACESHWPKESPCLQSCRRPRRVRVGFDCL
jgi:hypothetical protein